jgi:S1-C subfamily serine protease
MKNFKLIFFSLIFFSFITNLNASDEDILKRKIAGHIEKYFSESIIQEPEKQFSTRSISGPRLFRQVANSVVFVFTEEGTQGSGILLSNKGTIVTNWHVVENEQTVGIFFKPSNTSVKIAFTEKDVFLARVLRTDRLRDLALLEMISPHPITNLAQLGNLSDLEVGQDVFAISHPKGLPWSYTEGVVSQIRPKHEWKSDKETLHRATLIQTQTVISFGSSGGPLFDTAGRLIGILVASKGPGLNFAIAVSEVKDFILSVLGGH